MSILSDLLVSLAWQLRRNQIYVGKTDIFLAHDFLKHNIKNIKDDIYIHCRLLWIKREQQLTQYDELFERWWERKKPVRYNLPVRQTDEQPTKDSSSPLSSSELDQPTETQSEPREINTNIGSHSIQNRVHKQRIAVRKPIYQGLGIQLDYQPTQFYRLTPQPPVSLQSFVQLWQLTHTMYRQLHTNHKLNVPKTVDEIGRIGFLIKPYFLARPAKRLLLLIDQQGSMQAFNLLIKTFRESLKPAGLLPFTKIFYFYNHPDAIVYQTPDLYRPVNTDQMLEQNAEGSPVIIISDAGAAYGYYSQRRVDRTKKFLGKLHTLTDQLVWLNPLPSKRWTFTTADAIKTNIAMYSLSQAGFRNSLAALHGYLVSEPRD